MPPIFTTDAYSEYYADLGAQVKSLEANAVAGNITVEEFFAEYEKLKEEGLQEVIDQADEAWQAFNNRIVIGAFVFRQEPAACRNTLLKCSATKGKETWETLKTGIIGCGGIANGKHMPTLAKMEDVEMVAFCDIVPERAQEAARRYGAPGARVYTDYRDLLREAEITDVRVLTDNSCHRAITIDALEAGKHVLCEKPLAITYEDAKRMVETSHKTGKLLTVGYQHRYNLDSIYLKKEMEAGTLGDVYIAKARVLRRRGAPTWGAFHQKEKVGGGPMIDVGTHVIDLVLWLLNNYQLRYVAAMTYQKLKDQLIWPIHLAR